MTFRAGVSPARLFIASTECSSRHWETEASPHLFFLELVSRPSGAVNSKQLGTKYGGVTDKPTKVITLLIGYVFNTTGRHVLNTQSSSEPI